MTAPTSLRGYVDDQAFWSQILADFHEEVPDLMWPTSVWTYGQMRRDPQLAALLKGYTYPIRRTPFIVDPAGCRPDVAQLVADDLGIPLAGQDQPGAARTRGVSWSEHIRLALLHLVFGHMGFELAGEIRDGLFRLNVLAERMPSSISAIRVDKTGMLTGIDQRAVAGTRDAPEIGVDRLLWYAHEREGANWAGVSLLREAYAPWLLKREMQRVHATANRRFGMGVPSVEWVPGATPTPAQHLEAAKVAQQARVGDTAGVAMPPGARLVINGLTGSVPDTLGFIRWLDQQMSRMALAGWLDLGDTPNGSRALGESFVDFFLLSLQTIADHIADTITRQAAARLVAWNWGDDEPCPRVVAADVGSRREVTAEALKALLDSGALAADPALEEYVRREWRLPAREQAPEPPASAPAPPVAARPARRVRAAELRRHLTDVEAAAGVDFAAIQAEWETARDQLLDGWTDAEKTMRAAVLDQIEAAVDAGDLAALGAIVVESDELAELIAAAMLTVAGDAATEAVREAKSQGVTIPTPDDLGDTRLAGVAAAVAGVIASGYSNAAARKALAEAGPDATGAAVRKAVSAHLADLAKSTDGWVADNLGQALTVGQNAGRAAVFRAGPDANYVASEVLDRNTCDACSDVDGKAFDSLADAEAAYASGGYRECEGGLRCRGIIVARWGG